MIEFLSSWIKDIVYIMVFIVFLEILLPNNSMRKYVNVVAGLLIMLVILTPITNIISKKVNMQDVMSRYYVDMNQIEVKNQNQLIQGQDKLTMNIYTNKIATQMKAQIEKNLNEVKVEVDVDVFNKSEEENFGEIKEVHVLLVDKEDSTSEIKPIEKIEFGDSKNNNLGDIPGEENPVSKEEENYIKELIFNFYNVPLKNIHVTKQKNS